MPVSVNLRPKALLTKPPIAPTIAPSAGLIAPAITVPTFCQLSIPLPTEYPPDIALFRANPAAIPAALAIAP